MKWELNKLKPCLDLFNAAEVFQLERWKKFKRDYNVTQVSMRVLFEAPRKSICNCQASGKQEQVH